MSVLIQALLFCFLFGLCFGLQKNIPEVLYECKNAKQSLLKIRELDTPLETKALNGLDQNIVDPFTGKHGVLKGLSRLTKCNFFTLFIYINRCCQLGKNELSSRKWYVEQQESSEKFL